VCSRFLSRHPAGVYTCIEAVTGTEGLAIYHSTRPDCLVLDFSLPDMDGLQFLAAMQAASPSQSCSVVLLTDQGNEQIAVQALREVQAPRQVTLTTRCNTARTQVTLEVVDSGPGIPPALRTRIFEPFFIRSCGSGSFSSQGIWCPVRRWPFLSRRAYAG
jgi:CheY-like chemotaxis protein